MIPAYLTEGIRKTPEKLSNSSPTIKLFSFSGLNGDWDWLMQWEESWVRQKAGKDLAVSLKTCLPAEL